MGLNDVVGGGDRKKADGTTSLAGERLRCEWPGTLVWRKGQVLGRPVSDDAESW